MKMKNKIIPLITPLAITGTIVPLTTLASCGLDDNIQMRNLIGFSPEFEKGIFERFDSPYDASEKYADWLVENASSFVDDYAYGTRKNWEESLPQHVTTEAQPYSADLNVLKFGCSTPKFGLTSVSYPGQMEQEYPTISVNTKLHAEFTLYFSNNYEENSSTGYWINYSIDVSSKLNNMLFFVKQHGLSTTPQVIKVKNSETAEYNAWNVTTFDRGNNSAYQYRTDNWSMDVSSKCERQISYIENNYPTLIDNRTNKFNILVDNIQLFNQVQNVLLQGNQLFDQFMKLSIDDEPYYMDRYVEELTGYRGAATDQFDILLYTASAATLDFASFYLSGVQAQYDFNTYQPLSCIPNLQGYTYGDDVSSTFRFYTYVGEAGDDIESYTSYSPWYLEKPTPKKEALLVKNDDPQPILKVDKIELEDEMFGVSYMSGDAIRIHGVGENGKIIYTKPGEGEVEDELAVPLKFVGEVLRKDPETEEWEEHTYTYDECEAIGQETFYLNDINLTLKVYVEGEGTPREVSVPIDQPLVQLFFKTGK